LDDEDDSAEVLVDEEVEADEVEVEVVLVDEEQGIR